MYGKQEPGETFFPRDCLGYMTVNINFFFFTIELHCIQNKVKGKIFGSVTLKKNKANRFFLVCAVIVGMWDWEEVCCC